MRWFRGPTLCSRRPSFTFISGDEAGSDDPLYFGASIDGEYAICRQRYGFDDDRLRTITRTAIEAGYCEKTLKQRLMQRV